VLCTTETSRIAAFVPNGLIVNRDSLSAAVVLPSSMASCIVHTWKVLVLDRVFLILCLGEQTVSLPTNA
jgi:hypothetical protein